MLAQRARLGEPSTARRFLGLVAQDSSIATSSNVAIPTPIISSQPPIPRPIFIPPAEDPLLHLLTNVVMRHGERHKAARIITDTLAYIHARTLSPPLPILRHAIELASPMVKNVTLRQSSKNVISPRPLNDRQRAKQAFRWMMKASDSRSEHKVSQRVAMEVIAIIRGDSKVLERKAEVHQQAVVNRYVDVPSCYLHAKAHALKSANAPRK